MWAAGVGWTKRRQAQGACEAVMGGMSFGKAATSFGVGRASVATCLAGNVSMDGRVGPGIVLSEAEENAVEDVLLFAARNGLLSVSGPGSAESCGETAVRRRLFVVAALCIA
ncbi:unnamed protein product [Ectocarpus sp. CCAP 1310/34]|nr:unnamed protein product [Ectocarpus sp. CCAP 1310/34]